MKKKHLQIDDMKFGSPKSAHLYCGQLDYLGLPLLVAVDEEHYVCRVSFLVNRPFRQVLTALQKKEPNYEWHHNQEKIETRVRPVFEGRKGAKIRVRGGTTFQQKVWKRLAQLPFGSTSTYSQVARHVGHPRASRAVGSACGANPVAILIPCHRVLASQGGLGGFGGGLKAKQVLLAHEGVVAKTKNPR